MSSHFTGAAGYETGVAAIQPVTRKPYIFCTDDVSLNPNNFHNFSQVMVVASIDWSTVSSDIYKYYAAAVQTFVNNASSFKACAHLVGVLSTSVSLPRINWMAVQINVPYQTNHAVIAGFVQVNSTVIGASLCKKMEVQVQKKYNI